MRQPPVNAVSMPKFTDPHLQAWAMEVYLQQEANAKWLREVAVLIRHSQRVYTATTTEDGITTVPWVNGETLQTTFKSNSALNGTFDDAEVEAEFDALRDIFVAHGMMASS